MKAKKILNIIFAAGLCIFSSTQAFAANEPVIFLSSQPVDAVENNNPAKQNLVTEEVKNAIAKALSEKLSRLKMQGALPFDYTIRDLQGLNTDVTGRRDDANMDVSSVSIIPVILTDNYHKDEFEISGTTFYRYQFRTEVSILFCNSDGGLHIFYNIPLAGCATVGNSIEPGKAITRELTEQEKQQQFLLSTTELIDKYFKVPANIMKFLKNRDMVPYQVSDVKITSNTINEKWSENAKENFIKPVLATSFTALYAAKHPEYIILPSQLGHPHWPSKVANAISGKTGTTFDEDLQDSCRNLSIELYKLSAFNIQKNNADTSEYNDIGIGVGMRNITDKKDSLYTTSFRIPKNSSAKLVVSWADIFSDAAKNLGMK